MCIVNNDDIQNNIVAIQRWLKYVYSNLRMRIISLSAEPTKTIVFNYYQLKDCSHWDPL